MPQYDDLSRVTFPVIVVKDGWISRDATAVELRNCSEGAIEIKFHEDLEIYDASGLKHQVLSVSVIEGFWINLGLRLSCWKHTVAVPSSTFVRFSLAPPSPYQFVDLRHRVMEAVEAVEVLQTGTFFELVKLLSKWDPYLGWLR